MSKLPAQIVILGSFVLLKKAENLLYLFLNVNKYLPLRPVPGFPTIPFVIETWLILDAEARFDAWFAHFQDGHEFKVIRESLGKKGDFC